MNETKYTVTVHASEDMILPLPELLAAVGRSGLRFGKCERCAKDIVTGITCVSCALAADPAQAQGEAVEKGGETWEQDELRAKLYYKDVVAKLELAERTLTGAGWSAVVGCNGPTWKPPLGNKPEWLRIEELSAQVAALKGQDSEVAQNTGAWATRCGEAIVRAVSAEHERDKALAELAALQNSFSTCDAAKVIVAESRAEELRQNNVSLSQKLAATLVELAKEKAAREAAEAENVAAREIIGASLGYDFLSLKTAAQNISSALDVEKFMHKKSYRELKASGDLVAAADAVVLVLDRALPAWETLADIRRRFIDARIGYDYKKEKK